MTTKWANHALQRTRPERRGCNRCVPRAGSLSLGRYPKMRALRFLFFFASMTAAFAGIDDSLDVLKKKYGDAEAYTYRPDLYPTSYVFRQGGVKKGSPIRTRCQ